MLVPELVDFSFELIGLLFFNHLHISLGDFLNLSEARMGESVALETDINQSGVLVQGFKHHGFDLFTEKVISKFDRADFLISLKGIYQMHETNIVESAGAKVEFSEFGGAGAIAHDHLGEKFENWIAQKVLVADQCLQVGEREDLAEHLEARGADLVERDVELSQVGRILEALGE